MNIKEWKEKTDLLLNMGELHDIEFRKTHQCTCEHRVDYGKGRWYCEAMRKHRLKDKDLIKLRNEILNESPWNNGIITVKK